MCPRASRLPAYRACLVGLVALAGCDAVVVLGSECSPLGEVCGASREDALPGSSGEGGVGNARDASGGEAPLDAGETDAGSDASDEDSVDAGFVIVDAGRAAEDAASGGVALPLPAANPSFELSAGSPGDFGASLLSTTDIAPWYQCQAVGLSFLRVEKEVNVGTPNAPVPVTATEGENFLVYQFPYVADLPVHVYQQLEQPLKAGQPYAFMIDVRTEGAGANNTLALAVRGTNLRCDQLPMTLATTPYLPSGSWEEVCVRFTPSVDLQHIAFVPVVKGIIAITFRMFIDNIREDPRCQ